MEECFLDLRKAQQVAPEVRAAPLTHERVSVASTWIFDQGCSQGHWGTWRTQGTLPAGPSEQRAGRGPLSWPTQP
jgi:hypothetical protein